MFKPIKATTDFHSEVESKMWEEKVKTEVVGGLLEKDARM